MIIVLTDGGKMINPSTVDKEVACLRVCVILKLCVYVAVFVKIKLCVYVTVFVK